MVINTIMDTKDTKQRCCSHCNKVHMYTSHRNTREKRAPHCRSDRQSPPKLSSPRCHCLDATNTASTTSGPSDATKKNTCLQPDTTSDTFHHLQVSHLTSHNTASSIETNLITDTALDGHTAFHTTLQIVTSQGCKSLQVKVDPGAESSLIPVSLLCNISKTFYQIWCFKEICFATDVCNMVSSRWKTQTLFRIYSIKHSTQDHTPSFTNKVLCFRGPHKPRHFIIICSIIPARHSTIHSAKQNTCQLPIMDQLKHTK